MKDFKEIMEELEKREKAKQRELLEIKKLKAQIVLLNNSIELSGDDFLEIRDFAKKHNATKTLSAINKFKKTGVLWKIKKN